MQSLADQSIAQLGGRFSVLNRQKADHVRLDRLLHLLDEVPPSGRGSVLRDIYRLVFPHAFAEEAVLWPVIRRVLSDGNELTLRVEQEHQTINELVSRLEGLNPGSPEHQQVLCRVVELLREDVRDEEDVLLPQLQERLSLTQLRVLGIAWEAVRRIAPTRAHSVVARRPPGNVLSALPLTLLDRTRDRVEASADHDRIAALPLRALGAALARTSRAVEHLPGMSRGEDPSTRVATRSRFPWAAAAVGMLAAALLLRAAAQRRRT
jgi:hemerythrin superfamily protein